MEREGCCSVCAWKHAAEVAVITMVICLAFFSGPFVRWSVSDEMLWTRMRAKDFDECAAVTVLLVLVFCREIEIFVCHVTAEVVAVAVVAAICSLIDIWWSDS